MALSSLRRINASPFPELLLAMWSEVREVKTPGQPNVFTPVESCVLFEILYELESGYRQVTPLSADEDNLQERLDSMLVHLRENTFNPLKRWRVVRKTIENDDWRDE